LIAVASLFLYLLPIFFSISVSVSAGVDSRLNFK